MDIAKKFSLSLRFIDRMLNFIEVLDKKNKSEFSYPP